MIAGKDLSVNENDLIWMQEDQIAQVKPTKILVAGSGVSAQTEAALIKEGVHPSQIDAPEKPKQTKPTYQEKGLTQQQEYEKVLGKEASKKRIQEQEEEKKRLFRERGIAI